MTATKLTSSDDAATHVAPTRKRQQTEQAWSSEDHTLDYEDATPTVTWARTSLTASAIIGFAALVAIVLIAIFGWTAIISGQHKDPAPEAAAPAPVTVTVTAPAPAAALPPPPYTTAEDAEFIRQLTQLGYTINNPDRATTQAHNICNQYRAGKNSQQIRDLETQGVMQGQDPQAENQFQTTASLVYPDCG